MKIATERVTSSEYDKGQVVRQTPKSGGAAAEGDTVTLTLSKGPEMIEVPDVVGDSVDDARQALEGAGFEVDEDRGLFGIFGDTSRASPSRAVGPRPRARRSPSRSGDDGGREPVDGAGPRMTP